MTFEETLYRSLEGAAQHSVLRAEPLTFDWNGYECRYEAELNGSVDRLSLTMDARVVGVLIIRPVAIGYSYEWESRPSENDLMKLRLLA